MKNRSSDDIVAEMLCAARDRPGPKTQLMSLARLNYAQLKEYLPHIVEQGLVIERHGVYGISKKGLEFLRAREQLAEVKGGA